MTPDNRIPLARRDAWRETLATTTTTTKQTTDDPAEVAPPSGSDTSVRSATGELAPLTQPSPTHAQRAPTPPVSDLAAVYAELCDGGRHAQSQRLGEYIESALNSPRNDLDLSDFSPRLLAKTDPGLFDLLGERILCLRLPPGCPAKTVEAFAGMRTLRELAAPNVDVPAGGTLDLTHAPALKTLTLTRGTPHTVRDTVDVQETAAPAQIFASPVRPPPMSVAGGPQPVTPEEFRRAAALFSGMLDTLTRSYEGADGAHGAARPADEVMQLRQLRSTLSSRDGLAFLNDPVPTHVPQRAAHSLIQHFAAAKDALGLPLFPDAAHAAVQPDGTIVLGPHSLNIQGYRDDRDRLQIVIAVPGLSGTGMKGSSAPSRAARNPGTVAIQAASIAASAAGAETRMHDYGTLLAPWAMAYQAQQRDTDVSVVAHSYGATAGARYLQGQVMNGAIPMTTMINPAPLPQPLDPQAYAAGLEAIGGVEVLRRANHSFISPHDPVQKIQENKLVHRFLKATHRTWQLTDFSTVHRQYFDPSRSGVDQHDHPRASIQAGMRSALKNRTPETDDPVAMINDIARAMRDVAASRQAHR